VQHRPHDIAPDVEQDEVDRPLEGPGRLDDIALAQVDEAGQAGRREIGAGALGLGRLILGAVDCAAAVVPHRGGQIEGRDAERGARLDDPARADGAAEHVAELRLVLIERHRLVGEEGVVARLHPPGPWPGALLAPIPGDRLFLRLAVGMQAGQQAVEDRIVEHAGHRRLPRSGR
jgi:hypothetical protein